MRIAVFADWPHCDGSSLADSLLTCGRALARRGHAVMLAIARGDRSDRLDRASVPSQVDSGLTILWLPSLPWIAVGRWPVITAGIAALRCRAWKPDIVHSQGPFGAGLGALAAARLHGVPLISTRR